MTGDCPGTQPFQRRRVLPAGNGGPARTTATLPLPRREAAHIADSGAPSQGQLAA